MNSLGNLSNKPLRLNLGWLIAVLCLPYGLSACATKGDFDKLVLRTAQLERDRLLLRDKLGEDYSRLERLHEKITEAESTLRKNGANLGIRMERLEQDLPQVTGDMESLRYEFDQLKRDVERIKLDLADRLGWTSIFLPPDLPKDEDGMWAFAEQKASIQDNRQAIAAFEAFEASFPKAERAPLALVKAAELYEQNNQLTDAIKAYQSVYERYETSPLAAPSTLKIAELFVKQGKCDQAKSIFQYVISEFRNSDEAKKASDQLRRLKDICR